MTPKQRSLALGELIDAWPYMAEVDKARIIKTIVLLLDVHLKLAQFKREIAGMSPTAHKELLELLKAVKRMREGTETAEDRELLASTRKEMRIEKARQRRLALRAKAKRARA